MLTRLTVWAKRESDEMSGRSHSQIIIPTTVPGGGDPIVARRTAAAASNDQGTRNAIPEERVLINGTSTAMTDPIDLSPSVECLKSNAKPGQKLLLIDLPREIRDGIWRLAVKRQKYVVDPTLPSGGEQPDLAMTCRLIRVEVLPIFYAENTFRVEASALKPDLGWMDEAEDFEGKEKNRSQQKAFASWAAAIEHAGWFSKIRRWCIECRGTQSVLDVVPSRRYDRMVMVSLILKPLENNVWGAEVEIHIDARCILPGSAGMWRCVVKQTPIWLNERIIELLDSARGGAVDGSAVVKLSRALQNRARDLVDLRCVRW